MSPLQPARRRFGSSPGQDIGLPDTVGEASPAGRWLVVLGANLGIAIGVAAMPALAISVFMRGLQHDLGWTRAEISLGPTIVIGVLALVSPLVGWLTDRVRSAWVSLVGLIGLAVAFLGFSHLGPDIGTYYLACAAMGLVASGAGTVPYARAVSASFTKGRGLALGVAMVGTGISAALAPVLLSPYAARVGWRVGYQTLALAVAVAAPIVFLLMRGAPLAISRTAVAQSGKPLSEALRGRTFWLLAVAFTAIPLAVGGLGLHLLSFLRDAGVDAARAGQVAGLTGLVQIASRLASGTLVDRFFAPRVGAVLMALAGLCLGGLWMLGASAAVLGPVAIGLALGAEIDLVGYMTARYYGLAAYGRIYGVLYALSLAGSSLSLLLYGQVYDATRSYDLAIACGGGLLVLAIGCFLVLPRFPTAADAASAQ